jgi:uncharacterized protein YjiS (DUF1127 family)
MSTISFSGLRHVRHGFAEWRHNAHLHNELIGLNDGYLRDIGITRGTGDLRPSRPLWLF